MYLRRIALKNLKSMADLDLNFNGEGGVRLHTALVGSAGLGKTTLLQAAAVALGGSGAVRELMPLAEGWVRRNAPFGEIRAELAVTEGDSTRRNWPKKTSPYVARYLVSGDDPDSLPAGWADDPQAPTVPSIVEWAGAGSRKERKHITEDMSKLKRTAYAHGHAGWFAAGYGLLADPEAASAQAGHIQDSGRKSARFLSLFRRDGGLVDGGHWLAETFLAAHAGLTAAQRTLDRLQSACAEGVLRRPGKFVYDGHEARVQLGDDAPLPLNALDADSRRMLAVGLDLARWMTTAFPESDDPLGQRGVVLIDDFDKVFEPASQRAAGQWLINNFPRLQFVVATERPFPTQIGEGFTNVFLKQVSASPQDEPALVGQVERGAVAAPAGDTPPYRPTQPRTVCVPS